MQLANLEWKVSVVDQDVDGTKLLLGRLDHIFDLIFLRHIGLKDHSPSAGAFDVLKDLLCGFFILVVIDDDRGAALCQPFGGGGADAAARSSDQRNLPLKRAAAKLSHGSSSR